MVGSFNTLGYVAVREGKDFVHSKADALYNLPLGSKVSIVQQGDSYRVLLYCPVWKQKEQFVCPSYSKEFTREEILNDVADKILAKFDIKLYRITNWS
jgi:hypothetical protein